jgi:PAS domain S-box-containing protein
MGLRPPASQRILAKAVFLVLWMILCAASVAAQGDVERKRILLLFTHESHLPAQISLERSIRSTLESGSPVPVEIYSEYLDAVRTNIEDYEQELVSQLHRKYGAKKFDLLLAINPPALKVLLKNRSALFPETPIVFLVLDQGNLSDIDQGPNMTGVWGDSDYGSNLELALSLHPGTKQVVVISGVSEWDKYWMARVQNQFSAFEDRVEFSYLTGLSPPELQRALAALPSQTIVMFVSSVQDNAGNNYGNLEVLRQITPVSSAPVYGISDVQLGLGIVGGKLLSFDALGTGGAEVGLRLLAGEKPEAIPPHGIPSVPMFDARQLQRWGISEASLPAGSIVQYKQPTVWEEYKWYIISLVTAIVVETLLIVWLLFHRLRRRQAETESARLSDRLAEIVSNVPGIVWESRTEPGTNRRTTTFISDYVYRMLGYTSDEWMQKPRGFGLEIMPEEERERVQRESDEVVETGEEAVSEFRWFTKDGRVRWVENYIAPIADDGKGIVGLRGVALDVTDRKLAEENARQAEEKDRAILAAIPDLMFIQTDDGVYLDYHAKNPDELLVSPEMFMGKSMSEVLPADLASKLSECFARVKDEGEPEILEYSLDLGGGTKWFEARMVRSGDKVLSIIRDVTDRVTALEELVRSEERFGKAFRANPQPMSITTIADGRYIDVNDSFLSVSGYTRKEVIGRTTMDLGVWRTPADRARFIGAVMKDGSAVNYETEFFTKDGTSRNLLTSAERLEIGGEDCLLVASSDITERYAAQQALRESNARLRMAQEAARVGTWEWDIETGASVWSEMIWELLGLEPNGEDPTVGTFVEFIHPEDRERVLRNVNEVIADGEEYYDEFRVIRADGSILWLASRGALMRADTGEPERMLGVNMDITERKAADEALREREERFRKMADDAPMMIWVSGTDKLCTYFNKEWLDFRGRTMDQELGDQWAEGVHPDDVAHCLEVYNSNFDQRKRFEMEYRLQRFDGEYRWTFDHGTPRFTSAGEFLGYIGTAIDITERKAADEALKSISGRLISAYEDERSRLAREIHDDLGQKIAILSMEVWQLGQKIKDSEPLRRRSEDLYRQIQEISADLGRLAYKLHPSMLNSVGLLAAVKGLCQEITASGKLRVRFRHRGSVEKVPEDITLCVFRIAQEALRNCMKHSDAESAEVVLRNTGKEVRLSVSDKGRGFDMNGDTAGQGLGLTSMQERLRIVGGTMKIDSKPSHGTRIEISIPLDRDS